MAEESGPLVGYNFTDDVYRAINGPEPAIVGDVDGSAYSLTLGAGTDDALLGSATQDSVSVVGGFMHRVAAGSTQSVTIPPSTNAVGRTDIIAVRYDAGTYTAPPGPCRLVRIAGVEGSTARPSLDEAPPGVEDFPLWAVTRKGNGTTAEGLNQAGRADLRRRTGPNLSVPAVESLPPDVPLGTHARRGSVEFVRVLNSSGTPEWSAGESLGTPTISSGWVSVSGAGHALGVRRFGNLAVLFGSVQRDGGSVGDIATIPADLRPASGATRPIGVTTASNGMSGEMFIANGRIHTIAGYGDISGSSTSGDFILPLSGLMWPLT